MHTVFGRVVDGQKYVTEIENQRVDTNHRPYADIRIVRCGELVLIKPSKGEKRQLCIECIMHVCMFDVQLLENFEIKKFNPIFFTTFAQLTRGVQINSIVQNVAKNILNFIQGRISAV